MMIFETENDPRRDPLLLWLTGGPGCSAFSGLVFEIGVACPLTFKNEEYNGSLPNLTLKPQSWTKVSSIIFLDLPASTGFSYLKTKLSLFLKFNKFGSWLIDRPEFLSNEVYIAGDSYCRIPVLVIVKEISNGNEGGIQPWINIQVCAFINEAAEKNYEIPFNQGMTIISDELYESLQKNCRGEYHNIDPRNALCVRDMQSYDHNYKLVTHSFLALPQSISGLEIGHVLEPYCDESEPRNDMESHACVIFTYWANDDNVSKALHIRKGSIGKWTPCNDDLKSKFNSDIPNSFQYHVNLSGKAWIRSLNYSIVSDWKQWYYNDQVAWTYSNRMTFATVKGGGHTAPEYKPEECLAMFS
ncbi:hypothetical protein AAZX31_U021300 [Glycine max]